MTTNERIRISPYEREWATDFEHERARLLTAIGGFVVGGVEHVGSTSVPGLAAKPIVDIQVGVAELDTSRQAFGPLAAIGYRAVPVRPDVMHFFEKRTTRAPSCNLQLIPFRSDCWDRRIAFRDYLRSNPMAAREYEALKRRLAERFSADISGYNAAKSEFIRDTTERALNACKSADAG